MLKSFVSKLRLRACCNVETSFVPTLPTLGIFKERVRYATLYVDAEAAGFCMVPLRFPQNLNSLVKRVGEKKMTLHFLHVLSLL